MDDSPWTLIGLIIATAYAVGAYLAPWFLAVVRHKRNSTAILLVDLLFGWTIVGWGVALVWAAMHEPPEPK